jgi:hypothetical protein
MESDIVDVVFDDEDDEVDYDEELFSDASDDDDYLPNNHGVRGQNFAILVAAPVGDANNVLEHFMLAWHEDDVDVVRRRLLATNELIAMQVVHDDFLMLIDSIDFRNISPFLIWSDFMLIRCYLDDTREFEFFFENVFVPVLHRDRLHCLSIS